MPVHREPLPVADHQRVGERAAVPELGEQRRARAHGQAAAQLRAGHPLAPLPRGPRDRPPVDRCRSGPGRTAGRAPRRRRRHPARAHLHGEAGQRGGGRQDPRRLRLSRAAGGRHHAAVPYVPVPARQPRGTGHRGARRPARGPAARGRAARGAGRRGGHQPVPGAGPGPRRPGVRPGLLHAGGAARRPPRDGGGGAGRGPAARTVVPGPSGLRNAAGPAARRARRGGGQGPAQPGAVQHDLPARRRRGAAGRRTRGPARGRSRGDPRPSGPRPGVRADDPSGRLHRRRFPDRRRTRACSGGCPDGAGHGPTRVRAPGQLTSARCSRRRAGTG